jgi:mono/diheme cytochrome c family protein
MWRALSAASILLLIAFAVAAQDTSTASKPGATASIVTIPVEEARRQNPVKPSPESLARAKKQYGYDCAMCHGKEGDGRGDVATDMKLKMNDETKPDLLKDRTDGELFHIIQKGKGDMPPEGNRVKDETIWDLVNYVRSFAKKGEKPAETAADAPAPSGEKTPN